jgi:hypothetical protein
MMLASVYELASAIKLRSGCLTLVEISVGSVE